jgi:rsbT antagonist protein RsbS
MSSRGAIPILRIGSTLLASVQVDLHDAVAEAFQGDVLAAIESSGARGLVVDITALETVDTYVARVISDTAQMARLMGTDTVLVGMRPEVAATLIQMGYPMSGVRTALNVDEGLQALLQAR